MTLLLPPCSDSRHSRCPPLPFRQSLSRIGYSFSIFHVTQCRLEVIPLTVHLPLIPAFSSPPLRWLAPLVVHGVRSPMFFRSPSHCSACLSFAQHCSPFIERALLAAAGGLPSLPLPHSTCHSHSHAGKHIATLCQDAALASDVQTM